MCVYVFCKALSVLCRVLSVPESLGCSCAPPQSEISLLFAFQLLEPGCLCTASQRFMKCISDE